MIDLELKKISDSDIFLYKKKTKFNFFNKKLIKIIKYHKKKCKEYGKFVTFFNFKYNSHSIEDLPFLPISSFKNFELKSSPQIKIIKTMTSSGTTNPHNKSKIFIDNKNSINQTKALVSIVRPVLGDSRLPMLIFEKEPNINDRYNFSARNAAINGFSIFAKKKFFLVDQSNQLNIELLKKLICDFKNKKLFLFGFTDSIFFHLLNNKKLKNFKTNLKKCILIHGGGWKKLENLSISNFKFKTLLKKKFNLSKIYNYYGLIEQTGSIFLECNKCENLRCSIYSDVLVRNKNLESIEGKGNAGLLQVLSIIPTSYPGNSILTEDVAEIINRKCKRCGYEGKLFKVHGRVKNSEIRGCANI